jgi:hypothetical protein
VGDGVQLGSLGTSATNWPIVLAPGDYEDEEFGGIMIGKETEVLRENLPSVILSTTNSTSPDRA